jgi:nitronate monooxygenase
MKVPKLQIGQLEFELPIVQGAMGVQVSSFPLPAVVANEGGLGTITSIVALNDYSAKHSDFSRAAQVELELEIRRCRTLTDKALAVNVMGAMSNVHGLIDTAVKNGIKMIVYGAGVPKDLPELVPDPSVNLVPIISSAKLAELLIKLWQRRYGRAPDAFILEGPLAGGHLGFSQEQLDNPEEFSLEKILQEVIAVVRPHEQALGRRIPIIAAGGIYTGEDAAYMLSLGAAGVQLGTRFVVTHECPAAPEFKQAYLEAKKDDVVIIHSPVGLLGRALSSNPFLEKVAAKQIKMRCPYHCIRTCDIGQAGFCIAEALLNAKAGQLDDGLIFAGANVYRVDRIMSVRELMAELVAGIEASPLTLPSGF